LPRKKSRRAFSIRARLAFNLEALTATSGIGSDIQLPPAKKGLRVLTALLTLLAIAALVGAFLWGRSVHHSATLEFRQVTFRSGTVYRIRMFPWHCGQGRFPTGYQIYSMGAQVAVLLTFCSIGNSPIEQVLVPKGGDTGHLLFLLGLHLTDSSLRCLQRVESRNTD
jgi:hypothetical protein